MHSALRDPLPPAAGEHTRVDLLADDGTCAACGYPSWRVGVCPVCFARGVALVLVSDLPPPEDVVL